MGNFIINHIFQELRWITRQRWKMQRHSEERGKTKQRKETTNVWAIVKIHLSKKTHVQRSVGQRAQRIAKRCERYVQKTGADGINSYLKYASKSTDIIFR